MVIHLHDTTVANRAVVRPRRFGHAALLAEAAALAAVAPLVKGCDRVEVVARKARPGENACPVVEEDIAEQKEAEQYHRTGRDHA